MSELIVEMEMPRNCYLCPMANFFVDKQTYCRLTMRWDECTQNGFKRPSWCPIKGVLPEEHGDLIDRDSYLKLLESYKESKRGVCENKEFIVALQAISKQIKCVKAVIAAERKDDEQN